MIVWLVQKRHPPLQHVQLAVRESSQVRLGFDGLDSERGGGYVGSMDRLSVLIAQLG